MVLGKLAWSSAALFSLLGLLGAALGQNPPPSASAADKWEATIAQFEAQDQKSPPPADAVLFVGSSSIRLWDLKQSFPDLATINRGFGGSQMSDVVRYARRIITPYKPRLIVLYEGDNDLAAKKAPEQVATDFDELMKIICAELPTTPLVVIGTKPSPKRWALIDQQRQLNRLLADRCAKDGHAKLLDVEQPMLDAHGKPKTDLFREDNLHLNAEGYTLWTSLLAPHLKSPATGGPPARP
jgi:lysophospholipase L1-like esterase